MLEMVLWKTIYTEHHCEHLVFYLLKEQSCF